MLPLLTVLAMAWSGKNLKTQGTLQQDLLEIYLVQKKKKKKKILKKNKKKTKEKK